MKKLMIAVVGIAVLAGCKHTITPETSWHDYQAYYTGTGATAEAPKTQAELKVIQSKTMESNAAAQKAEGKVLLGTFRIDDGTEITYPAVMALAKKLNASTVLWSSATQIRSGVNDALPNADLGMPGLDYSQVTEMRATRRDETMAEQMIHVHTIEMWGVGAKENVKGKEEVKPVKSEEVKPEEDKK